MARRKAQRPLPASKKRPVKNSGRYYVQQEMAKRFAQNRYETDDSIPLTWNPTATTWPENGWDHRRTTEAGYNRETETLAIKFFTNGAIYHYYDVPPEIARAFRKTNSPGKYINAVLNQYDYSRIV